MKCCFQRTVRSKTINAKIKWSKQIQNTVQTMKKGTELTVWTEGHGKKECLMKNATKTTIIHAHKNTDAYQKKKKNKNKTDLFTTNVAYKFEWVKKYRFAFYVCDEMAFFMQHWKKNDACNFRVHHFGK